MRTALFVLLLFSFFACQKEEEPTIPPPPPPPVSTVGQVELIFKPVYQGAPLVFFQDVPTGQRPDEFLYFKRMEFFVDQITAGDGQTEVPLLDVGYVDFNDLVTTADAEEGVRISIADVPVGTYDRLAFGVGVDEALNATDPGDFGTLSPMGRTGRYWYSWSSYIFSKTEGIYKQPNGSTIDFVYHTGIDGMHQSRSFNHAFEVQPDKTTSITVLFRGEALFFTSGQQINIFDDPFSHSGDPGTRDFTLAKRVLTNLADALHVQ